MQSRTTWKRLGLAVAALGAMHAAQATNGYFPHGFGLKAKGMGGAAVATAQDGFAGVNNPAASAFAGNRWDLGAEFFMPQRDALMGGTATESGRDVFLIPEFGYNVQLSKQLGVGLTVYGNGGMNTSYDTNLFGGTGKLGVDLMQLIVAPTVAYQFAEGHSFGVSPLLVLQRFEAYGLQGFDSAMRTSAVGSVTNRGKDTSTGLGVRFGYMGQVSDALSVGASYSPKINMSRFDKYAGLFAGAGDFDIPENYSLGMALKVTPDLMLALDIQRINYSKVPSIGNASTIMAQLGTPGGPGFGWTDVNVVKLGVQWKLDERWTLRAGYNHGDNPIRSADAMFNILAPGVVRQHITLGGTYSPNKTEEWTFAAWHGKRETVVGPMYNNGAVVDPTGVRIGMSQNGFGLQYSRKF
jgi:long-chain fatty acid transport protein